MMMLFKATNIYNYYVCHGDNSFLYVARFTELSARGARVAGRRCVLTLESHVDFKRVINALTSAMSATTRDKLDTDGLDEVMVKCRTASLDI